MRYSHSLDLSRRTAESCLQSLAYNIHVFSQNPEGLGPPHTHTLHCMYTCMGRQNWMHSFWPCGESLCAYNLLKEALFTPSLECMKVRQHRQQAWRSLPTLRIVQGLCEKGLRYVYNMIYYENMQPSTTIRYIRILYFFFFFKRKAS